jgi:hypothetical protein
MTLSDAASQGLCKRVKMYACIGSYEAFILGTIGVNAGALIAFEAWATPLCALALV